MPPETAVASGAADTQAANPASETQAPSNGGTDGAQPQDSEATVQTASSDVTTLEGGPPPAPPPPPPAPAISEERLLELAEQRIAAREAERQAREDRERTLSELRDLRRNGPKLARQTLDKIAEEAGVVIPSAYRESLEDWAENLSLKAVDAARIELGDEASKALGDEQQAFIDACYAAIDPAKRAEFTAEVNNKGHSAWVAAAAKYAPRSDGMVTVDDLASKTVTMAGAAKHNLSDGEKTALAEAVKGAKTPDALLGAVFNAGRERERQAPGTAPSNDGVRVSEPGYTRAQISKMNRAQLDALPEGVFNKVMGI